MVLSKLTKIALAVGVSIAVGGYWLYQSVVFDRRTQVAADLMLDAHGKIHPAALQVALESKFPPGTPIEAVKEFVKDQDGQCKSDRLFSHCTYAYAAQLCAVANIVIDVKVSEKRVISVKGSTFSDAC